MNLYGIVCDLKFGKTTGNNNNKKDISAPKSITFDFY